MYSFADVPPNFIKSTNEDGVSLFYFYLRYSLQLVSPELTASFLNRLTIWWFNGLCSKGLRKPLEVFDLYALNPGDTAAVLVPRWFRRWDRALKGKEEEILSFFI